MFQTSIIRQHPTQNSLHSQSTPSTHKSFSATNISKTFGQYSSKSHSPTYKFLSNKKRGIASLITSYSSPITYIRVQANIQRSRQSTWQQLSA